MHTADRNRQANLELYFTRISEGKRRYSYFYSFY